MAKTSNNISEAGIESFYDDFLRIDWNGILGRTNTLKIAVSYANTWRESNRGRLSEIVQKNALTVFLPNYHSKEVWEELAFRFGKTTSETIKDRLVNSSAEFKGLGATVYLYNGCFQTTYYLTDHEAIMAPFNHKQEKAGVPAIRAS